MSVLRFHILCIGVLFFAGCSHASGGSKTGQVAAATGPAAPRAGTVQGDWTLLHTGASYPFLPGAGTIRIDDITAGKTVVKPMTIFSSITVTVSPDTGISVAGQVLVRPPLPPGHQYQLWWKQ